MDPPAQHHTETAAPAGNLRASVAPQPPKLITPSSLRSVAITLQSLQATKLPASMRRTLSRNLRTKPAFARLFILGIFLASASIGSILQAWWTHSSILITRAVDGRIPRYTAHSLQETIQQPRPRPLTLISSLYEGNYPAARIAELRLVVLRNLQLPFITHYELVHDGGEGLPGVLHNASGAGRLHATAVAPGEADTYRALFSRANSVARPGEVVVIANADIYFDASLACAGLLRTRTALALSRHPSPDCVAASGRGDTGWEPADFCAGYDPVSAASHDAFAFVAPMSNEVLDGLGELRVNEFGAENVVVWLLRRAGYAVLNPCANVHAFHQHCDVNARARSAKQARGNVGQRRRQFAGAERWGFIEVGEWAEAEVEVKHGLDCLGYGMVGTGLS